MRTFLSLLGWFFLTILPPFEKATFAHSEGLPTGGKTIAGPGRETLEQAKPAIVLQSQTPIPPACITVMNMTLIPMTIRLNDAPTNYVVGNGTSAFCWGKGVKRVSLHVNDPKEPNRIIVLWRIDVQ